MKSKRVSGGLILVLSVVLAGRVAPQRGPRLQTRDVNRDGRPDLWEYYDESGRLLHKSIDTNFDGKADLQQSYEEGELVRRESDRNFDDRIDLTDEFDPKTGERTRSTFDVDFDGRADLLVLFSNGKPAFTEWAHPEEQASLALAGDATRPPRLPNEPLRAFVDPFAASHRLQSGDAPTSRTTACAGGDTLAQPVQRFAAVERVVQSAATQPAAPSSRSGPTLRLRGPPTFL